MIYLHDTQPNGKAEWSTTHLTQLLSLHSKPPVDEVPVVGELNDAK